MENPNYVGKWGKISLEELYLHEISIEKVKKEGSYFHFFIDGFQEGADGLNFKGRCLDIFGESRIMGKREGERFSFYKGYTDEAKRNGGSTINLKYEGITRNIIAPGKGLIEVISGLVTAIDLTRDFDPTLFVMRGKWPSNQTP